MFEAAVAMSRKWDAGEAGSEVGKGIKEKLKKPPKFVLLFSTIHYEKYGGFQKFLDAVNKELPEGTPVVGGTVAGFMNNYGCYTIGASAMAVYDDEMDVAVSVGYNAKRSPRKAVDTVISGIPNRQFKNRLVVSVISGGMVPQFMGISPKKTIQSNLIGNLLSKTFDLSLFFLQKGVAREEEILSYVITKMPNDKLISVSTEDNNEMIINYQFLSKKVVNNAIIFLVVDSNHELNLRTDHGLKPTGLTVDVTELASDKRWMRKINGKPAKQELLRLLNWPEQYVDEKIYTRSFYYPFASEKNGFLTPFISGLIWGESVYATYQLTNKKLRLLSGSGSDVISSYSKVLSDVKNPLMVFAAECGIRIGNLGSKVYLEHKQMKETVGDTPFLSVYVAGEATFSPEFGLCYGNHTVNAAVLYDQVSK